MARPERISIRINGDLVGSAEVTIADSVVAAVTAARARLDGWAGAEGARMRVGPPELIEGWEDHPLPTFDWVGDEWRFVGFTQSKD